jgi:hypothetical protein
MIINVKLPQTKVSSKMPILKMFILSVYVELQQVTVSFVMSVCLAGWLASCPFAWNNSAPTGWIFMKFDI